MNRLSRFDKNPVMLTGQASAFDIFACGSMANYSLEYRVAQLEESKRRFGAHEGDHLHKLLATLSRQRFADAAMLIRYHEALLFVRAYPQSAQIIREAEKALSSFAGRVERLRASGADLSLFEDAEVSGIAGTSLSTVFSYDIARRLAELHPGQVEIDWEGYEITDRLAPVWRLLFPLIEDDTFVEAEVPYLDWLRAAMGRSEQVLPWLLHRLKELPVFEKERGELYDSLALPVRWELGDSGSTRSKMRRSTGKIFYHRGPLLRRSDISLAAELEAPPLLLNKLAPSDGQVLLDMARETTAMRYRELYGFTYGDSRRVVRADAGRGVEIFMSGLPADRRLPLRAYHAALIFKNGVPIGYFETLSLFERMEVGFNLFYTFRDGETAWLFARLLRLFRQVLGVTCYSMDPYQIGWHNEEAIESGAFWFYRKLGFRPMKPEIAKLAESEEKRIQAKPGYKTSLRTLRQLANGYMIYEINGSSRGAWDRFQVRNLGLAVQRHMGQRYGGNAARIREASTSTVARALGVAPGPQPAFQNLSLVLALIPDLARWTKEEKAAVCEIIRAKMAPEEARYVRLLQAHRRLHEGVLKLGS